MERGAPMLVVALVLARVLADASQPAPTLTDETILVMKRTDLRVGNGCMAPPDAGASDAGPSDAGASDAGPSDAGPSDAGPSDAGPSDAGPSDAGPGDAAGNPCMYIPGNAVTVVMQPHFSQLATGARFAILMVTPAPPIVEVTAGSVFSSLDAASAPVIQEVTKEIEDPAYGRVCGPEPVDAGCGGGPVLPDDPYWEPPMLGDAGPLPDGDYSIDRIGAYEVVRATPATASELATWLTDLGYLVMPDDIAAIAPYIAKHYTVVAVRVALDDTPDGLLAPIALTWAGDELRLPAALGSTTAGFPTTVYIAADRRYDFAGATVPFAMRVNYDETRFLTKNLVAFAPGQLAEDPVAIPSPGSPEKREIVEHVTEVHVPVRDEDCGCGGTHSERERDGIGCGCQSQRGPRADWLVMLGAIVLVLVPRRRRRSRLR